MSQNSTVGFAGKSALFTPSEVDKLMRIEFERAQRYTYSVACLLIQVDHLQALHTVHGFESREEVLHEVVELVKRVTRAGDLLGYLVEDRLLAIFPHTSSKAVKALADRLLLGARSIPFRGGTGTIRVTLSIGVSHNEGQGSLSFETLKRVAEEGLVVADAGGGDRWAETELYGLFEKQRAGRGAEPAPAASLDEVARDPSYRAKLERMVARDGDLERAVAELVEEILSRAVSEAHEDLARSPAPADESHEDAYRREIDLLQRRVAKLTESLGLSEQEIRRLRKLKNVEDGVASVYRDVQGLDGQEEHAELKRELMQRIFEANLDLQGKRRTAG